MNQKKHPDSQGQKDKTKCPECGSDKIANFSSYFERKCHDCGHAFPWPLEKGQRKII